jgi:alpha-tubulin suppressor-like RCC1 family protein
MKNLLSLSLVLTTTTMAFAQGKLRFCNNIDNLIYLRPYTACSYAPGDAGKTVGGFSIAGSSLYTGAGGTMASLAGSPTLIVGLWGGTSPSSMTLRATTTIGDVNFAGLVVPVNVILAGLPAGTPAWFQVQVYDSSATNTADAWARGFMYAGESPVFQATPQAAVFSPIYQRAAPVNSTWAPGTYVPVDYAGFPGYFGGIEIGGCLGPYWLGFRTAPTNQAVVVGATATFYVGANSCPYPYYQWYFNGVGIPGAAGSSLQISNAQPTNAGTYSVVLSNQCWGSQWGVVHVSESATLTVRPEPIITSPPQSQTAVVGSTVNFQASAAGAPPLAYQWSFNGSAIPGAGSTKLQLTNLQVSQSGSYTVVVTNTYGAVTSSPAILTVVASPPTILNSPLTQTAMVGWSLDLTVSARGSLPLTYQWFFDGSAISGASDDDLHLTNLQLSQSGTYIVIVTNAFGAVTSAPAMLNVIARPPNPPAGTVVGWGDLSIPYVAPGTRFTAIAAGSLHSLALKSDGTVVAWGENRTGQSTVAAGLSGVIAIAAGGNGIGGHSLALKSDGTVVAWGSNENGQTSVPADLSGVIAIAAGAGYNMALKSDRTVISWGAYGETNVPTGLSNVIAIAAGYYHSLALKSDGTVVAWGGNDRGQTSVPADLGGVTAIAAGGFQSLALKSDGTVVAWGGNIDGQTNVPAGLSDVIALAAGYIHSLALKSDGTVVAWGANTSVRTNVPAGLGGVIAIAAGEEHSLALKSDGTVVAWGDNGAGQCTVPGSLSGVIALASGNWMTGHGLALKADGTVATFWEMPLSPTNLSGVLAIAAGESHGLALKSDGNVIVWADNYYFQTNVPAGLSNVLAIAAGGYHSLAVQSDRTVRAWGADTDQSGFAGQSTVPPGLSGATAVAGGEFHSVALKSDGTVVAWGSNKDYWGGYAGQSVVPAGLSGVLAIAAGGFHSLALKSDGTVAAWGNNSFGQCEVPGGLNGVVGIAAGQYHSLALKSDGTVVAWGDNQSGECTVPVGLPGAIGVFAGGLRSLALVAAPPILLTPPASQTAEIGSTVEFYVNATGSMPLNYEWFFNSTIAITGSTTNCALLLTNVQPSLAGAYTMVVTNIAGAVTSPPAMLSVIPPVERRPVPGTKVTGEAASVLNVDYANSLSRAPHWTTLGSVSLTSTSQYYFDLTLPLPPQRFYRAWQTGTPGVIPSLDLHLVPAITLTGNSGDSVRLDYINQFGPTDAWVTLATVPLTNTSQLYFDVSAPGQPTRLYRVVQVP